MNPFAVLGVTEKYAIDLPAAERTYKELVRALHPDRHTDAAPSTRREALSRAVLVNEAWRVLRDPIRRAEVLFTLRGVPTGERVEPQPPAEFLMNMMEIREELAIARVAKDGAALERLVKRVEEERNGATSRLSRALDENDAPKTSDLVLLGQLRFYKRFLEEAQTIRDEWENAS